MNLLASIASALPVPPQLRDESNAWRPTGGSRRGAPGGVGNRPVLQYVSMPTSIDSRRYRDALSPANPSGDLLAMRAFRDLVDPLPAFGPQYTGQGSTEMVYGSIVHGAKAQADNPFAGQMIAGCLDLLNQQKMPPLGQVPGTWAPVYATPGDWADARPRSRFDVLEVDLTDDSGGGSFSLIGSTPQISLQTETGSHTLQAETRLLSLRMKYLFVTIERPWLNHAFFATRGWQLRGQPRGFCSTGDLVDNTGVMPLLPTGLLVAKDVELEADWAPSDQRRIDREGAGGLSLGPIPIADDTTDSTLHVIAWVSRLLPLAPE